VPEVLRGHCARGIPAGTDTLGRRVT
jgi:hypothetical protein